MPALDPRQIGERVAAIFRARQPIDVLPDDLIPGDLDTAYRAREAFEADSWVVRTRRISLSARASPG